MSAPTKPKDESLAADRRHDERWASANLTAVAIERDPRLRPTRRRIRVRRLRWLRVAIAVLVLAIGIGVLALVR